MNQISKLLLRFTGISLTAVAVGCSQKSAETKAPQDAASAIAKPSSKNTEPHRHKAGAHGGMIIAIGADNHHAEVVFEKGGTIKLFTLGTDESKILEVDAQTLHAFVKKQGETVYTSFTFESKPQSDDAVGKTSQFVATIPNEYVDKQITVSIPNIRIGRERYRFSFASGEKETAQEHTEMPDKITDEEERQLYLVPGGLYTAADIAANGKTTASLKFAGIKSSHEMKTKPGDKICPITETKTNPKFTWIIDGKSYEFCCPPCVDEFVKLAKEDPKQIKEPSFYVKAEKK